MGFKGAGRLTDKVVDKTQIHYGSAIRHNKGKVESMRESVQAILKHMVQESEKTMDDRSQKTTFFMPKRFFNMVPKRFFNLVQVLERSAKQHS